MARATRPPSLPKARLARLLARRPDGIFIAPFEAGEIGPDLFRAACNMGLEARSVSAAIAPTWDWIKVKNRKHPPISRVMEAKGVYSSVDAPRDASDF